MHSKLVHRYYCDFCGKANCSAPAMRRHENHCTLNPKRKCRMCRRLGETPVDVPHLIATIWPATPDGPDVLDAGYPVNGMFDAKRDEFSEAVVKAKMAGLMDACHGCPACVLAVLRQSRTALAWRSYFNYEQEKQAFWTELNDQAAQHEYDTSV